MRANNETPTLVTTNSHPSPLLLVIVSWTQQMTGATPLSQTHLSNNGLHQLFKDKTDQPNSSLRLQLFTRGFLARSWLIWCKTDVMIHANTFPSCPASWVCWEDFVTCNDFVYLNSSAIRSNMRKHCGQYQMIFSSSPPLYLSSLNKRQQMTCVKFN